MTAAVENLEPLVEDVAKKFPNDIIRIRYHVGEDWSGDPGVFFRVLITDEAGSEPRFAEFVVRIGEELSQAWYSGHSDLFPYYRFRTKSEQDRMQDPAWE